MIPRRASSLAPFPALLVLALCAAACREGTENTGGSFIPIVASAFGTQGCAPSAGVPASASIAYQ